MADINTLVQAMTRLVTDPSHGYDQAHRWGPDYDCSSSIITALKQAGFDVDGATYTGNMRAALLSRGWKVATDVNLANGAGLHPGDILLNDVHHVALYVGGGKLAAFRVNELGTASGGKPGDQTGRESELEPYYNFPWNVALRFVQTAVVPPRQPQGSTPPPRLWKPIRFRRRMVTVDSLNVRSAPSTSAAIVATYKRGQIVNVTDYADIDGIRWNRYVGASGQTRYIAEAPAGQSFKYLKAA